MNEQTNYQKKIASTATTLNPIQNEKRAIEQQTEWLGQAIQEAHLLFSDLENRLAKIGNAEPEGSEVPDDEPIGVSELYHSLRSKTQDVHYLQERIRRAIRTIEL